MRNRLLLLCLCPALLAGEDEKPAAKGPALMQRDTDGDGRLSPAEFGADREVFDLLDRDGDGFIAAAELPKPRQKPGADAKGERARKEAEKSPAPPPGPGDRPWVREMASGILERFDKDGDGRLSGDEIPREGRIDLEGADRNADGAIDLFELTLAVGDRAGERPEGAGILARRLKQMDANKDGVIEKAEWQGPIERFDALDADRDGKITEAEAKKAAGAAGGGRWMDRNADAAFRRFDADQDGKITADEWKARPETFQLLDANKDGVITREELTPKGPGARRGGSRPDVRSGKDSAHFLEQYDANRDGQVTKEEFPHERRFSEIDADGNGVLSEAEIKDSMDRVRNEEEYGLFERYDLNEDEKITRDEFTGPAAEFERLDRNRDGVLDKADGAAEEPRK